MNKQQLKEKLDHLSKEDYEQWASTYVGKLFFEDFLDEVKQVIADRKIELPVESLSNDEIVSQMRALSAVDMFIDDLKGAKYYDAFVNTFDLDEEEDDNKD